MNDEASVRYLASPARREDGTLYCWKCEELERECSPCRRAREQLEHFAQVVKESKASRFTVRRLPLYLLGIALVPLVPLLLLVLTVWWSAAWLRRHLFLRRCRVCGGVFVDPDRKPSRPRLSLAVRYGEDGEPNYWLGDPLVWKRHFDFTCAGRRRT